MRVAGLAAALVMVSFTACTSGDSGKPKEWKGELPIAEAFLRKQLPPDALAYARVPNLLGLFAMPKDNQLDAALRSEANITTVTGIQQGLAQNVLTLPTFSGPWVKLFADALRSPVEIVGFGMPNPAAWIGATLPTRTAADVNRLFDELGAVGPVRLAAPLDDKGIGELVGLPIKAFVKFDPATGRLLLLVRTGLDRGAFERALTSLPAELKDHPMYALEQKIDASGQGLFTWVDAARIVPLLQLTQPDAAQALAKTGLGGLRAVAFGLGTANGKGRLSFVVDVGNDRKARPLPVVANDVKATAVGDPDAAILVSIPGKDEMLRLESMLLDAIPPSARSGWEQAKAKAGDVIGVDLEEIFSAIGPDVIVLFDQAGDYTAVRLRDPDLFDDIVKRIAAKTGSGPVEHKVGGTIFQHWRVPSIFSLAADADADSTQSAADRDILAVLGRMQNHFYWVRDGEYLYVASSPQPLIDRVRAGAKVDVAQWLASKQRVDMSTSLFAATGSVSKMPRRTYEAYLGMLQGLADITEAKFDVWSMPTADQLALSDKGAIGVSLNLGEPYLSLELTYENHPTEMFFGASGVGAVAVVGILAAIAIPAYEDYTIRAQVTEGLNLAASVKAAVAETYAVRGTVPRNRRAAGLSPSAVETSGKYVESVDVSGGVITITYGNEAKVKLRGETLTMTPFVTPNRDIGWLCGYAGLPAGTRPLVRDVEGAHEGTTIQPKYLPSVCR